MGQQSGYAYTLEDRHVYRAFRGREEEPFSAADRL